MHPKKQPAEASRTLLVEAIKSMAASVDRVVELAETILGGWVEHATPDQSRADSTTPEAAEVTSVRSKNTTQLQTTDLRLEDMITFAEASATIRTRPSISTISRWCSIGVRGLKLESITIGGARRTTKQAV